jgi:hypothetical protein
MLAIGRDLPVVQRSLGHASPSMTLGIYAQAMDLGEDELDRPRALVGGELTLPTAVRSGSTEGNTAVEPTVEQTLGAAL